MQSFGIIGVGNMGEAILRGALSHGVLSNDAVHIFDANTKKMQKLEEELGVHTAESIAALTKTCGMVLLAVKPNVLLSILESDRKAFDDCAVLSIVAGFSRAELSEQLPADTRILRIMPNTPAMVGEGMIVFESEDTLREQERDFARTLFTSMGRVLTMEEKYMHAVTAVSGSGPAYVFMFIEALADGGVRAGLPRDTAYFLASQTVLGSARMLLETKQHPGALKDNVCSPGGTTIDAVAVLEEKGLRSAVIEAVAACAEKSKRLAK